MKRKKLTLQEVVDKFNLQVVAGDQKALQREIEAPGVNRAGLELTGFNFQQKHLQHRIVLLGGKENQYINQLTPQERKKRYQQLIDQGIPVIFTSVSFIEPELVKLGKELNFPIIKTEFSSNDFYNIIVSYIDNQLAPFKTVHGSLINVYGLGVLIQGDSGIGKSENTLELVKKGHLFVGDDAIVLQRYVNKITGRCDEKLQHHIEIRGIGILDMTQMYGLRTILDETNVDLIIHLKLADDAVFKQLDRLKTQLTTENIFGIDIPAITIPVTLGRNISELIEAAVINTKLHHAGINSSEMFVNKIDAHLKK